MHRVYHANEQPTQLPLFTLTKICYKCVPPTEKPIEEFQRRKVSKDGYSGSCKVCISANIRRYSQTKPIPEKKTCPTCDIEYDNPEQAFGRNSYAADGLTGECRTCRNAREMARYYKNPSKYHSKEYYRERYATDPLYREKRKEGKNRWLAVHPLKSLEYTNRRIALKENTVVEPVNYEHILERDGWQCHICGKAIDPSLKKDPACLNFDHVIPLTRNGIHAEWNIKPAHRICNYRKHDKLMEELTEWHRRGPTP